MSTKKDGLKTNTPASKQKTGTVAKTKTLREKSTDRINNKNEEAQIAKRKTTTKSNIKTKLENNASTEKKSSRTTVHKETSARVSTNLSKSSRTSVEVKNNLSTRKPTTVKRRTEDITTPPSNRVMKTQYFPSKNIYSNALPDQIRKTIRKSGEAISKEETVKKPKKTVSDKVKKTSVVAEQASIREFIKEKRSGTQQSVKRDVSPDSSSMSERPRTVTLRKGSIVNKNIVGPEAPEPMKIKITKPEIKQPPTPQSDSDECKYEDDFESYESDFEAYSSSTSSTSTNLSDIQGEISTSSSSSGSVNATSPRELTSAQKRTSSASTDDEKKMDSGNFEMPEYKHKHILDNIKESIEKENTNIENSRTNPASLSDEGFEDAKSLQFINFIDAQKRQNRRKSEERKRKRGEEILSMIRLDAVNFTIFDLPSVPYEVFIKNYGNTNTIQTSTQTGEDSVTEEAQTDPIGTFDMWTQMPAMFYTKFEDTPEFWNSYKAEHLGVGGSRKQEARKPYNDSYLDKFVLSAGKLVLDLLDEGSNLKHHDLQKNNRDIPFSDGYVTINTGFTEMLRDQPVTSICFSQSGQQHFITAHDLKGEIDKKSLICMWAISDNTKPVLTLSVFGEITCCSCGLDGKDYVFGGLSDGSLVCWDTNESDAIHRNLSETSDSQMQFRTPTFRTQIGGGHKSKVVGIQSVSYINTEENYFHNVFTNEICTLEEEGCIIIWSVITKHANDNKKFPTENQGMAHWGSVAIVKNTSVFLNEMYPELPKLQCTDFVINNLDPNHIYVCTNYGYILHCLVNGNKTTPRKLAPDEPTKSNGIEACPFSPQYFLSGYDDGSINLYSRNKSKPLIMLTDKDNDNEQNIQIVKWSHCNPFLIYSKDASNVIHIWDLCQSDLYPICSIPFKDNITSLALSTPSRSFLEKNEMFYLAIGTSNGLVQLHVLNRSHSMDSEDMYRENLKRFFNYVNRL